jgi:amidase
MACKDNTFEGNIRGNDSLVSMSASALSHVIAKRQASCVEVMEAYLEHIARYNPAVNALVSLQSDDLLREQALERDRQLARGEYLGWLHGLPFAVKDLSPVARIPMTLGSPLFAHEVPSDDGLMPSRIRNAGAIMVGKTNTPEFGLGSQTYNPVFGATRNAYNRKRTAGGSSGGAAAALAMHLLPVADGSDMMGSLRNPAAFNNIFGMRPSFGRVPRVPAPDVFCQQLGTEGPMGRTVTDVARLLATQAGPDPRCPLAITEDSQYLANNLSLDPTGVKIGWLGDWNGHLPMEEGILPLCEQALQKFSALGCYIENVVPDFDPDKLWRCWLVLRQWAIVGGLGVFFRDPKSRNQIKPEAIWEVERGLALSAMDVHEANIVRSAWHQCLTRLFAEYDFLMIPAAQVFPFDVEQHWPTHVAGVEMTTYHRWMEVTIGPTLGGTPTISLPVGFNEDGLPMGMQLIGAYREDWRVLQLARVYEQASPEILSQHPIP